MKRQISYLDYKQELKETYLETFEQIESYCRTEIMPVPDYEDCMGYLLDIFVTAQADQVPVEKITGGNMESFCKNFLKDAMPHSWLNGLLEFLKRAAWAVLVFLLFTIAVSWGAAETDTGIRDLLARKADLVLDFGLGILAGMVAGLVSNLIVRSFIFRVKKYRKRYHTIVEAVTWLVSLIVIAVLPVFGGTAYPVSNGVVLAVCAGWLLCCYLIRGLLNKRSGKPFFHKEKQTEKISFTDEVMANMIGEYRKMYEKGNRRREKKGKPALSQKAYMEKIYKDTENAKIQVMLACGLTALIYLGGIVLVAMDSTLADTMLFAGIMISAYAVIMWPIVIYPFRVRMKLVDLLKKSGKSVFDEDVYPYLDRKNADNRA